MTDRDKIVSLLYAAGHEVKEADQSVAAGNRRFTFNDNGELIRVLDYNTSRRATANGSKRVSLRKERAADDV